MDAPVPADRIAFLESHGARQAGHTDADLLSHLSGTCALLEAWGERPAVSLAGLFHSVYGTEIFQKEIISSALRAEVKALVGEEAEALAFLFGRLEKESFYASLRSDSPVIDRVTGEILPVTGSQHVDLCHLSVANWLEQRPRVAAERQMVREGEFRAMRRFLREPTRRALDEAYGFDQG